MRRVAVPPCFLRARSIYGSHGVNRFLRAQGRKNARVQAGV